jgi:5'-nucleotidase
MDQPVGTVLNLNVPNVDGSALPEFRAATLAEFGIVQTTVAERGEDHLRLAIADSQELAPPESDFALLAAGFATVTGIQPVTESHLPDLSAVADRRRS